MRDLRNSITSAVYQAFSLNLEKRDFSRECKEGVDIYKRRYDWGFDQLTIPRIAFLEDNLEFGINISRRYNFIEELWQDWAEQLDIYYVNNDYDAMTTIVVNHGNASEDIRLKDFFNGSLRFKISDKDLSELTSAIDYTFQKIFEKLDLLRDVNELDALVNNMLEPPAQENQIFTADRGFMFKRMILAKLSDNEQYEQICDLYRNKLSKVDEIYKSTGKKFYLNYPVIFENIYSRLENIRPMKKTILSPEVIA